MYIGLLSSETQGQLEGAGRSLYGREKTRGKKSQEGEEGLPKRLFQFLNCASYTEKHSNCKTEGNNDLDKHIQAKASGNKRVRRFGDILAPLSSETKLSMRFQE